MKIEKGKFYRTRGGEKVEVLTTERNNDRCVVALHSDGDLSYLHQNGMYYNDKSILSLDLIAEWTEPVEIPWSDYPTWCKSVAMDEDGEWYCYDSKPRAEISTWINEDFVNAIHPNYTPRNFTGDWTESLFERPQK